MSTEGPHERITKPPFSSPLASLRGEELPPLVQNELNRTQENPTGLEWSKLIVSKIQTPGNAKFSNFYAETEYFPFATLPYVVNQKV